VISSLVASRKAAHLYAGHPRPTAPPTQSPISTTATPAVSPFLTAPFPVRDPTSHLYRRAESVLASFSASVDAPKSPSSLLQRRVPHIPRFRALALLRRLLSLHVDGLVMQASEHLHISCREQVRSVPSRATTVHLLAFQGGAAPMFAL
jgi:hypothetical protein